MYSSRRARRVLGKTAAPTPAAAPVTFKPPSPSP
jgi:hypothetical protein